MTDKEIKNKLIILRDKLKDMKFKDRVDLLEKYQLLKETSQHLVQIVEHFIGDNPIKLAEKLKDVILSYNINDFLKIVWEYLHIIHDREEIKKVRKQTKEMEERLKNTPKDSNISIEVYKDLSNKDWTFTALNNENKSIFYTTDFTKKRGLMFIIESLRLEGFTGEIIPLKNIVGR